VRRVARLRRCGEFVRDVFQVFTERAHDLRLETLLPKAQAHERISFAEDFSEDGRDVWALCTAS